MPAFMPRSVIADSRSGSHPFVEYRQVSVNAVGKSAEASKNRAELLGTPLNLL
jgi:hypothetical protein